jgi:hypothetical protein
MYLARHALLAILARTTEVGARTLVAGACAGEEADGEFLMDGRVRGVVGWVETEDGRRCPQRVFEEVCDAMGYSQGQVEKMIQG